MITIILLLMGFLIGGLVIAMGGGGATFYLGILTELANVSPAIATSTSLLVAFPSLIIGAYSNYRTGNMRFKIGNIMLISAIPMVIIGSLVSNFINDEVYKWIILVLFVTLGLQIIIRSLKDKHAHHNDNASLGKALMFGGISGAMVGIAGLSGGGPLVAGMLLMGLEMPEAAATSSYVLVATSVVGMIIHSTSSPIAWHSGIALMIGAMIGSAIMPKIIAKFNAESFTKIIQPIMGVIMIIMGIFTAF